MTKRLTYVEIDVDYCANTYGVAPCTASIPTTGDIKCFNSLNTCQDRPNFVNSPATLRFGVQTGYLPKNIPCIPSLLSSPAYSPGTISLGEDLGERTTVTISFEDHPHGDVGPGFDKYVTERGYDPYKRGTFWGKFRARQPFIRGRPIRVIQGFLGQTLAQMETRHYIMDSFQGPNPDGTFQIIAKDVLKLADDERSQAPFLSNGLLDGNITSSATSLVLQPSGIGNDEYPASGYLSLAGNEVVSFTRSGDSCTIARGQFGTTAVAHSDGDRAQLCLQYTPQDVSNIIYDLCSTYALIDTDFLPLSAWLSETQTFNQRNYSALIGEPTGVRTLLSELIKQAGLALWWDDIDQVVRLQVLRAIPADAATFDRERIMEGSLKVKEQPEKRRSQVWTYFGKRDPLKPTDDPNNYRSVAATVEPQSQSDYGSPQVDKIFSRWIPFGGRTIALRINDIVLGRYTDPPRRFNFDLFYNQLVNLGTGYKIGDLVLQDATGAAATPGIQVTRLAPGPDRTSVEAEELLFRSFDLDDLNNHAIIIDDNAFNINLRTLHDSLYAPITADNVDDVTVNVLIEANNIIGSTSISVPAFNVGDWPFLPTINIILKARMQGKGGRGSNQTVSNAEPGGIAFYTRVAVNLDDSLGAIWGGGGGGGRSPAGGGGTAGGGGAGTQPGPGGQGQVPLRDGTSGTDTTGGTVCPLVGGTVNGGGPGQNGINLVGQDGAQVAGFAIDGLSYITPIGSPGDRRGPQVN